MANVTIVQTASALAELQEPWLALRQRASAEAPCADPHWLRAACASAVAKGQLRLLAIREQGELVGVVPLTLREQGRGPLRRNVASLLRAVPLPDAGARGSLLVGRGFEQVVVNALVSCLENELSDWQRLELAGMPTDGVMPSLLLANAGDLGVPELSMAGFERRRSLQRAAPARHRDWAAATRQLMLVAATDDTKMHACLELLERGLIRQGAAAGLGDGELSGAAGAAPTSRKLAMAQAAGGAREHGAMIWGLHRHGDLVAAALTLRGGHGNCYVAAAAVGESAPAGADHALHAMLIENAMKAGADAYVSWCPAPQELFDDNCPMRSLSIERYSAINTRNRLWNRLVSWRR